MFWGNEQVFMTQKRRQGFVDTINESDYPINLKPHYHTSIQDAKQVVLQVIKGNEAFDAIFCTGDGALIGTIQAIKETKTPIPETLAIVVVTNGFIPTLYDNIGISMIETNGIHLGKSTFARMSACWAGNKKEGITLVDVHMRRSQ